MAEGHIERLLRRADAALLDGIKKADRIIDEAAVIGGITAKQAARASRGVHARAKKEQEELRRRGAEKLAGGVSAARRAASGPRGDLEVLEALGRLRKSGVITEREFREKKKILGRI